MGRGKRREPAKEGWFSSYTQDVHWGTLPSLDTVAPGARDLDTQGQWAVPASNTCIQSLYTDLDAKTVGPGFSPEENKVDGGVVPEHLLPKRPHLRKRPRHHLLTRASS